MNEEIKKRLENEITLIGSHANNHSFFKDMVNAILDLNNIAKELQKRNAMLALDFRKVRDYVDDSIKELKDRSDMVVRDLKKVRDYVDGLYKEKEISEELPEWIKRGDHS